MPSIQGNAIGMMAHRYANQHQGAMSKALQRLSSGLRINSAADDSSGMARMQKMRAQLAQLEEQESTTLDHLSQAEIADGTLANVQDIMNRMTELAAKALP